MPVERRDVRESRRGGGNLEVLKWARANGCEWDATTCAKAAEGGHFDVLRWARVNGCPWDEATQAVARTRDWFDAIDRACYALPFLPRDVLPFILCEENLPDPADLASLRSVSRAMRFAVDGSGRSVKEMDQSQAARRGCLAALKRNRTRAMLALISITIKGNQSAKTAPGKVFLPSLRKRQNTDSSRCLSGRTSWGRRTWKVTVTVTLSCSTRRRGTPRDSQVDVRVKLAVGQASLRVGCRRRACFGIEMVAGE